jgi:chromate transporter
MMFKQMLELFLTFAKVGVMTFGGGYAMLPILQREVVENKGWATEEELSDYFAIGQCTPGVIAVNTATFIGRKKDGIPGAIVATLGVVFPSMVIISLLAGVITQFSELSWVKDAFAGIRVCVCVLIFNSVVKLVKKSVIDPWTAGVFALVAAGAIFLGWSPVVLCSSRACAASCCACCAGSSRERRAVRNDFSSALLGVF